MGFFGKSKAEKAAEAEEERELARLRQEEIDALVADEAQDWIDAVERHRNGATWLSPELRQAAGEPPLSGTLEEKREYLVAAKKIAEHKGNAAKVKAALSFNLSDEEKVALMTESRFWVGVQDYLDQVDVLLPNWPR